MIQVVFGDKLLILYETVVVKYGHYNYLKEGLFSTLTFDMLVDVLNPFFIRVEIKAFI